MLDTCVQSKDNELKTNGRGPDISELDVLIVEDDAATAQALQQVLARSGYQSRIAGTLIIAHQMIQEKLPDLVLLDLGMPDGDGVSFLNTLDNGSSPAVIVVSGANNADSTLACLRAGVVDYLQKPFSTAEIKAAVDRAVQNLRSNGIEMTTEPYRITPGFGSLFGQSEFSVQLSRDIKHAASLEPCRTLISGEAGVLKPEVAALVHENRNGSATIIYVNCAAEADENAGFRFFGSQTSDADKVDTSERVSSADGYLARAAGGTLILDDITSLPKHLQASLCHFMKSSQYTRVGALEDSQSNCAVIGIIREPAVTAIADGRMSSEFYYAITKFEIKVPPLRERKSDITVFIDRAVNELNAIFNGDKAVCSKLREQLCNYEWPGNLVEFKNVLLASYLATGDGEEIEMDSRLLPNLEQKYDAGVASLVGNTFWEVDKRLMNATLESVGGNKRKTAQLLGISLKTLYNRMNAYS